MQRAAIYARYSSDLQNDRSIEDQVALCRAWAEREGYTIVEVFADRARSGTTIHGRAGLQSLLHDARGGAFAAIITESLDRLSRDTEDLSGLYKRLQFAGVDIMTVHDGQADALQVGIRGLLSTLFIGDLKHKTRRGLSGVIRDGRHAGGRAYGYRPTPGEPGVLQIFEPEAAIVRRIFREYLAGAVPRTIASGLNADGIAPPRGEKWNASTINGNKTRGHGILQNPLYIGRIVWNKTTIVRNPETGKRVPRMNPESAWEYAEAPQLALIPADQWHLAQDEKARRSHETPRGARKHKRLLSGLLRCSCCGGGMTMHDKRGEAIRIRCSTFKESGSCSNSKTYRLDLIEHAVIEGLIDKLSRPELVASYIEAAQQDRRNEARARATAERSVAKAKAAITRLQKALIDGRVDEDFFDREIIPLREDLHRSEAALATAPDARVVTMHPAALSQMRAVLELLRTHLPNIDPEEDREMFDAFRSLIDRVVIHDRGDGQTEAEVIGRISALVGSDAGDSWGGKMVARGGLEPPTP
ncbi:recombinase family protein [Rhodobacter maris]|uniref:recombinase family protein n=1 Tax=Rhodobacter maris TaxID=446682 RepID=UPI000BE43D23|nr:recombinase family protein [Rhodobacter maris]